MAFNIGERGGGDMTEDIKYIREVIQSATEELTEVLFNGPDWDETHDSKYDTKAKQRSFELAEQMLMEGVELIVGHDEEDSDVEDQIVASMHKLPYFLFICAPLHPKGSVMRKAEEEQSASIAKDLMRKIHSKMDYKYYNKLKRISVESYDEMLEEIKYYASKKYYDTTPYLSQIPFVVFLSHKPDGKLCFRKDSIHQATKYTPCGKALDAVFKCFEENQPKEMPEWQPRFVFAECCGNQVDENNTPLAKQERGIEYDYIKKKATSTTTMNTQGKYDSSLLPVIQGEGKVQGFLDAVFSFLYRRTDFYQPLNEEKTMGFPEGAAQDIVLAAFSKYQDKFEGGKRKADVTAELGDKVPKSIAQPQTVKSTKTSTSPM